MMDITKMDRQAAGLEPDPCATGGVLFADRMPD